MNQRVRDRMMPRDQLHMSRSSGAAPSTRSPPGRVGAVRRCGVRVRSALRSGRPRRRARPPFVLPSPAPSRLRPPRAGRRAAGGSAARDGRRRRRRRRSATGAAGGGRRGRLRAAACAAPGRASDRGVDGLRRRPAAVGSDAGDLAGAAATRQRHRRADVPRPRRARRGAPTSCACRARRRRTRPPRARPPPPPRSAASSSCCGTRWPGPSARVRSTTSRRTRARPRAAATGPAARATTPRTAAAFWTDAAGVRQQRLGADCVVAHSETLVDDGVARRKRARCSGAGLLRRERRGGLRGVRRRLRLGRDVGDAGVPGPALVRCWPRGPAVPALGRRERERAEYTEEERELATSRHIDFWTVKPPRGGFRLPRPLRLRAAAVVQQALCRRRPRRRRRAAARAAPRRAAAARGQGVAAKAGLVHARLDRDGRRTLVGYVIVAFFKIYHGATSRASARHVRLHGAVVRAPPTPA